MKRANWRHGAWHLILALAAFATTVGGGRAIAGDLLPMLKAGDDNRRCYQAEAPDDIVYARLESEQRPQSGQPVAPLLLSIGRYVIDLSTQETAIVFGLSAKSAGGPFVLMSGGGCGANELAVNCTNDCIGGVFAIAAVADGRTIVARPADGSLVFSANEGKPPGTCNISDGTFTPYLVFSVGNSASIRIVETAPEACKAMIEPLELKSVR